MKKLSISEANEWLNEVLMLTNRMNTFNIDSYSDLVSFQEEKAYNDKEIDVIRARNNKSTSSLNPHQSFINLRRAILVYEAFALSKQREAFFEIKEKKSKS